MDLVKVLEFITELSGKSTLVIPDEIAQRLPKAGRARVLVLTEDVAEGTDAADWQTAAYQQFLADDSPEDAIYDSLK